MSSTKNFLINADGFAVRSSGGTNLGAGTGGHLVVGLYSGYLFRSFAKFGLDWSGVTKITAATLLVRNSTQSHIAFGSLPRILVQRCTANWSEGSNSCESGYSSTNALVYPGPAATATGQADSVGTIPTTESAWTSIDITAIVEAWAPASVLTRANTPGGAAANYGLRLISADEASTSRAIEFTSRETSSDAYIHLTYETNQPPNAPTLTAPLNGIPSSPAAPTFAFSAVDADPGDTLATYDLEVATSSAVDATGKFTTGVMWTQTNATTGITGWAVSRAYAGSALVGGTTYYWHARVADNNGAPSAWSVVKSFVLNRLPTVADADLPYAKANHVAPIWNMSDLVTAFTPKPQFTFTPRDPDGDNITAYDVQISGQAVETVVGNWASGTAIVHKSARTLVNGTAYTVQIRVKDSNGEYGPYSSLVNFKVWYGQAIYEWPTAGSSQWTVTTTGAAGTIQLLYRSATGAAGAGAGAWKTSLPTTATYLNIMVRSSSAGTAPVQPKISTLKIAYQTTATLPYNWTPQGLTAPGAYTADDNTHRYGTSAVMLDLDAVGAGGNVYISQDVAIDPTQTYAFGVWVRGQGFPNPGPTISMYLFPGGSSSGALKRSSLLQLAQATGDWLRLTGVATPDDLQGNNTLRIMLHVQRSAGVGGQVWFDAAMLAEGNVLPVWTPALVGNPVIIDANGAVIDGTAGAIFRLLGSGGGARDIVELGVSGLVFGGDTELNSPAQNVIQWGGRQRALFVIGPWIAPVGFITASQTAKQVPFAGREVVPTSTYDGRPNFPFNSGRIIGIATRSAATPTAAGLSVSASRAGANVGTAIVYASGGLVYQSVYFAPVAMSLNQSVGVNFDTTAGFADSATQAFSAWLICEADYPSGVS